MRRFSAVLFLAVGACLGCGDASVAVPRTQPVTGTVTYKNKPASGARITLRSTSSENVPAFLPTGTVDKEGKFTLSTGEPNNGAPVGEYIVTLEMPYIDTDRKTGNIETELDAWKGKYADPATSPHKVTIVKGDNVLGPINLD